MLAGSDPPLSFAAAPIRTGRVGHDASGIGLFRSTAVVDGYIGPLAREPHRNRLTDTGGRSGNQNVFAFETLHAFAPVIPFHVLHPQGASEYSRRKDGILHWLRVT